MSGAKTYLPPAGNLPAVIPVELIGMQRWLLWKAVPDAARQDVKPRKFPCYVGSGRPRKGEQGSPEDLAQLTSFEEAWDAYRQQPDRWAGVGFALINGDGVGAIDLDDCLKNGKFTEDLNVQRIVKALEDGGCYMEVSPSGGGLRAIGPTDGFNTLAKPPYEAYSHNKFVTITGHLIQNAAQWESIDPVVRLILGVHALRSSASLPNAAQARRVNLAVVREPDLETPDNVARAQSALDRLNPGMGYDEWFNVGAALHSTGWGCAEDLFRKWSARSAEKYSDAGFDQLWRSLKPNGGIAIGTLYHMAKDAGWQQTLQSVVNSEGGEASGDVLNGQLFAEHHRGTLVYVNETSDVVSFDRRVGWHIAPDREIAARRAAQQVLPNIHAKIKQLLAAGETENAQRMSKHHAASQSLPRLDAMAVLGWTHDGMTVGRAKLDGDPDILGVKNGILNLKSGRLTGHSPDTLVTKRARVTYDATACSPAFIRFLDEVQPDVDVQRLLQQIAGLTLWGRPGEQRLFFLYGTGANGKSTFIELLNHILGDYAALLPAESLIRQDRLSSGPTPDTMKLLGARGAFASEVREGRLDEERVKLWTGCDTISARPLYGNFVHFAPSHTFIMTGNHQPSIHDTSVGIWRRILLIGFNQHIPEGQRDPRLPEKLRAEGSGILNWMLRGLSDYWANGLKVPISVAAATNRYQQDQDIIGQWIKEVCNVGLNLSCPTGRAYASYTKWCIDGGMRVLTKNNFSRRLAERGHIRVKGDRDYQGLELIPLSSRGGGGHSVM
jgi:putative DNA primase/helicase